MKVYHFAALAVWYLVLPPESSLVPGDHYYPLKAPLSEWRVVDSVDSQEDCDQQNKVFAYSLTQNPTMDVLENTPMKLAKCITADEAMAARLIPAHTSRHR
jgi:hypothetical protein